MQINIISKKNIYILILIITLVIMGSIFTGKTQVPEEPTTYETIITGIK